MAFGRTLAYMKRTTIWLTEQQLKRLADRSKKTGIKVAELIRRLIDDGLVKRER
jgi:DNA-binding MarR family transcriptional regulator